MSIFGIPDNADVDETAEAETYAVGVRDAASVEQEDDAVTIALNEPFEVVRLAFSKTEAGATEIASWSEGAGLDLELPDVLPPIVDDDDTTDGDGSIDDFAMVAEAASMGGGGIFLLLLLLLV